MWQARFQPDREDPGLREEMDITSYVGLAAAEATESPAKPTTLPLDVTTWVVYAVAVLLLVSLLLFIKVVFFNRRSQKMALVFILLAAPLYGEQDAPRKLVAPVRGEAAIELTAPNTQIVGNNVVTTMRLKNVSSGAIAGLRIEENWFDRNRNPVPGDVYRHPRPWLVGEVIRRVSGEPVGRFLEHRIAGPLGARFWIGLPPDERRHVAWLLPPLPDTDAGLARQIRGADAEVERVRAATMGGAFAFPADGDHVTFNDADIQAAEIPGANGIGECDRMVVAEVAGDQQQTAPVEAEMPGHRIVHFEFWRAPARRYRPAAARPSACGWTRWTTWSPRSGRLARRSARW